MTFPRKTLADELVFEGAGLHSGEAVRVRVLPGEKGIWFSTRSERVEAKAANVTDTTRCTRLGTISTVEHLMSAFAGSGITDAEVVLDFPELPALDGASLRYAEAIVE